MKKRLILITLFLISFLLFSTSKNIKANADSDNSLYDLSYCDNKIVYKNIDYFHNGSYLVTTLYSTKKSNESQNTFSINDSKSSSTSENNFYEIAAKKEINYYLSDDTLAWTYILYADFLVYENDYSICTNTNYYHSENNKQWVFENLGTRQHDDCGIGNGNYKYKILFVTIKNIPIDVRIYCDKNGNLTYTE